MSLFFRISIAIVFFFGSGYAFSQQLLSKRTTLYTVVGTSGAKLNQFDQMLEDRGLTGLRNRYRTLGLGYQSRINDFVIGLELYHNRGANSDLDGFKLGYRTSRVLLNVGYAFTEESKFQLIHYMSLGMGYLNFQMLPSERPSSLEEFGRPKAGIYYS